MAIAAVPNYLGQDFSTASPGDRYTQFLPLWGVNRRSGENLWTTSDIDYEVRGQNRQEREVKKENKTSAITAVLPLNPSDQARMQAIAARQSALIAADALVLDAQSTAPFATGLGIAHPLENGFSFLKPYGLPYLPGSSIKGVLRRAAQELAQGLFGDKQGWSEPIITALFGLESEDGATEHQRGTLTFWDVIPQVKGDKLVVEIMTPHQSHYLQGKASPHDSGSPNPISFLAVPAGSGFNFHITCDRRRLKLLAPELVAAQASDDLWRKLITAAFAHAFDWLGFGAKTAVGYGAMRPDGKAHAAREYEAQMQQQAAEKAAQEAERQAQLAQLSPLDRAIAHAIDQKQAGQSDSSAVFNAIKSGEFEGDEQRQAAEKLQALMQADKSWKPTTSAKKPEKDKEHQRTLQVIKWLS